MPSTSSSSPEGTISLPKHWPRRVRSAVVHAVSMANMAFAATRSQAENHFNARVRLQAENDRLRREMSLLDQELSCAPPGAGPWRRRRDGFS